MKGGCNALPVEREAACRMWAAGMSRRAIAAQLGVAVDTVSHWRWKDMWPNRKRYADRPIVAPKLTHRVDAQGERVSLPPGRITYACPGCGCRALESTGHPVCRRAAA